MKLFSFTAFITSYAASSGVEAIKTPAIDFNNTSLNDTLVKVLVGVLVGVISPFVQEKVNRFKRKRRVRKQRALSNK